MPHYCNNILNALLRSVHELSDGGKLKHILHKPVEVKFSPLTINHEKCLKHGLEQTKMQQMNRKLYPNRL